MRLPGLRISRFSRLQILPERYRQAYSRLEPCPSMPCRPEQFRRAHYLLQIPALQEKCHWLPRVRLRPRSDRKILIETGPARGVGSCLYARAERARCDFMQKMRAFSVPNFFATPAAESPRIRVPAWTGRSEVPSNEHCEAPLSLALAPLSYLIFPRHERS